MGEAKIVSKRDGIVEVESIRVFTQSAYFIVSKAYIRT